MTLPGADAGALEAELETLRRRFGSLCEVEGKLGQGAMGAVYRVRWNDRVCALKVLLPKTIEDEKSAQRFLQEGEILVGLSHPNILKVCQVGRQGDWPYMLCELVEGGSVEDLSIAGPLAWERAFAIVESVLEALKVVHERKIYHRDIKPSNLLLAADGTVKLADFGIAKLSAPGARKTTTGMILGTPAYIAPEQLKGRPADARSDLFSLGVVLWELLAGGLPWPTDDDTDIFTVRLTMEVPRLTEKMPALPRSIDTLVAGALATEPVHRFPSAGTFLLALRKTRDRLKVSHGNALATRHSDTAIPSVQKTDPEEAIATRGGIAPRSTPAPAPMDAVAPRVRSTAARRVPMPAAEADGSRARVVVTGLVALAFLVTVVAVAGVRLRRPAEARDTVARTVSGPTITLAAEDQRLYDDLLALLVSDGSAAMVDARLEAAAALPGERGRNVLYLLWRNTTGKGQRRVALRLIPSRHPLAVPAICLVLCEIPDAGDATRRDAARALIEIAEGHRAEECPDPMSVVNLLGAVLKRTAQVDGGAEHRDVIRAAIRGIGWVGHPATSADVIAWMRAAPERVNWLSGEPGADPHDELRRALARIDNAHARKELESLRPARGRNLDRLTGGGT